MDVSEEELKKFEMIGSKTVNVMDKSYGVQDMVSSFRLIKIKLFCVWVINQTEYKNFELFDVFTVNLRLGVYQAYKRHLHKKYQMLEINEEFDLKTFSA